jgi:superfamily I DNA/RNA helicase
MLEQTAEQLNAIGARDHSVTREYRIYGPPGTGKTTECARQVRRGVDRFGPNSVLVTSFSRATAAELAGRDVPLDSDRIGTLHSHCYRALGKPPLAEVHVKTWNRRHPDLAVTPVSNDAKLDGEHADEQLDCPLKPGDPLLQELNRCRALMLPREVWPPEVRKFGWKWNLHKAAYGLLDFCDLIEQSYRCVAVAPHNPRVIIADEAQDLTPLMAALLRKWGARADYFVLAGDDDQLVYGWVGATPDVLLKPQIPDDHMAFLGQSYRVPRAVHRMADKLIRQVTERQEKNYDPRPAEGAVVRLSQAGYRSPEYFILKSAEQHLRDGKSIIFIASCSYMLRPLLAVLRKHGIPFHNPYRRRNGFWNPLRLGSPGSAASRIRTLLAPCSGLSAGRPGWTHGQIASWAAWLRNEGVLRVGALDTLQKMLKKIPAGRAVGDDTLRDLFEPEALATLTALVERGPHALLGWWRDNLAAEYRKRVKFPADVVRRCGVSGLKDSPQVVVGTIHSVKGGQADVVYLFPDLSRAGDAQYQQPGPARDSVIRTFYVGTTRARETLYICSAESALAVRI